MKEKELKEFLAKTAKVVEPAIRELLESYLEAKNKRLVNYQISTGGKRLRPAVAIISCSLLGGRLKDVLYPAAGLEILHNYSLIVDDIIDNSFLRRGRPTTWKKFGRSMAECLAIAYSATTFQAPNRSKNPVLISELFAKTIKEVVEGEILDILFEQADREDEPYIVKNRYFDISDKNYLKMVSKKTASLSQACCEVGGICAGANPKQIKALRDFGFNAGIAFQIKDDILDIFGEEKKFGKKIGNDIKERKLGNIVILYALKELKGSKKTKLLRVLRKPKRINKKEVEEMIELIGKTGAREKAEKEGKRYVSRAKKSLDLLPQNKYNSYLQAIADFAMKREK